MTRVRKPREVFVSHSHKDHRFADELVRILEEHGVRSWFAPRRIQAAARWQREIGQALRRCDWLIVVVSPAAISSMWVEREVNYALQLPHFHGRIIPIHLKRCKSDKLLWALSGAQHINCVAKDKSIAFAELLRAFGLKPRAKTEVRTSAMKSGSVAHRA